MAKRLGEISAKSKVNEIKIKYNGETFRFNLNEELSINPKKLNEELKEQPSYYGFLLLLRNRLLTTKEDLEIQKDKVYAHNYLKTSDAINPSTNRPYSDKAAVQKALSAKSYIEASQSFLKAKQDYNDINSCVMAFEQRSSLIQSLSANVRAEK
jgi:hypothetical protein